MACCVLLCYDKPKKIFKVLLSEFRNIPKLTMKKETVDMVKEALLGSILETKDQDDLNLDQVVRNTNNPRYCTNKEVWGYTQYQKQ